MHIQPMGRKKKTQFGKGRGRNELIAEWIKQDTGEIRDRKQISSHIQVLTKHLANVPECVTILSPFLHLAKSSREAVNNGTR